MSAARRSRPRSHAAGSTPKASGRAGCTSAGSGRSSRDCVTCSAAPAMNAEPCSTRNGSLTERMAAALTRLGASLPLPPDLAMCRRVAEHAEILGYESLWIADTGAGPDAFVVAAMAAMVMRSARIGTAVVPLYTRALPVHAAGAGSVAQLAPGRFILGVGVSSETIVDTWGGVPFRRP